MAFKIQSTKNINVNDGIKILVYGAPKLGKTRLIRTLPNPFIAACETGCGSGLLSLKGEDKQYPFTVIANMTDIDDFIKWVSGSKEANNFESICLDSISEMADIIFVHQHTEWKGDARKVYPAVERIVQDLIRKFLNIKKNVYFTAKEQVESFEGLPARYGLKFPGQKLPSAVPFMFDEIFRIWEWEAEQEDKTIQKGIALKTKASPHYFAGDRSGTLDEDEEADLSNIINKIIHGKVRSGN